MKIKFEIPQLNRLIRYFVISDLFFVGGWGLIGPIFALFIVDRIEGATIATVGIAAGIYWVLKSLAQLPMSVYLDKTEGEKDEFYFLIGGLLLASVAALLFIFVREIWQLYILQIVHAIAFAAYTPAWTGMFSLHLDKEHYSFDWTLDSTIIGLASGASAAVGAYIAEALGYNLIFIAAAIMSFVAAVIIFIVPDIVLPKQSIKMPMILDHRPPNINH